MDISQLRGIIPPLATPLHDDGTLNTGAIAALVEHVLAAGVHAVFATGSQGEAFALSAGEKRQVLDATLAAVNGRVPVMAGTGAITTRDAVALSRAAESAGADCLSVITPYFVTPTQDELYAHFAEVASAVSIPVLAYSNPSRTGGVRLTAETLARLAADCPNIVGVKDSGGDLAETAAMIRACPPGFRVFVGRDSLLYGGLCYGAVGTVALSANLVPELFVGVYEAFGAGDHARARALQDRITLLREALPGVGSYPAPVKAGLALLGVPVGPPRRPILPLNAAQIERLHALLRQVGKDV